MKMESASSARAIPPNRAPPVAIFSLFSVTPVSRRSSPPSARADESLRLVANGLNVVPIRVQNERPIVVLVIVRSRTRTAIVFSPGGERRSVELVHLLASLGAESDMHSGFVRNSLADPEIGFRRIPVAENGGSAGVLLGNLHHHRVAKRRESLVVELAARDRVA